MFILRNINFIILSQAHIDILILSRLIFPVIFKQLISPVIFPLIPLDFFKLQQIFQLPDLIDVLFIQSHVVLLLFFRQSGLSFSLNLEQLQICDLLSLLYKRQRELVGVACLQFFLKLLKVLFMDVHVVELNLKLEVLLPKGFVALFQLILHPANLFESVA